MKISDFYSPHILLLSTQTLLAFLQWSSFVPCEVLQSTLIKVWFIVHVSDTSIHNRPVHFVLNWPNTESRVEHRNQTRPWSWGRSMKSWRNNFACLKLNYEISIQFQKDLLVICDISDRIWIVSFCHMVIEICHLIGQCCLRWWLLSSAVVNSALLCDIIYKTFTCCYFYFILKFSQKILTNGLLYHYLLSWCRNGVLDYLPFIPYL